MKSRKLILRADGHSCIGQGHIYRTLAFTQMVYNDFDCSFVSHERDDLLIRELDKINVPFIQVPAVDYLNLIKKGKVDEISFDMGQILTGDEIVVTDGYWFGVNYQKAIKSLGCMLLCIDDTAFNQFHSDVVLNHAPGFPKSAYNHSNVPHLLLGLDYSLIRKSFLDIARGNSLSKDNYDLMICFGGSDPMNLTEKVLREADMYPGFDRISVVLGGAFSHMNSIKKICAESHKEISIFQSLSGEDMIDLMLCSKTGVFPASSILYEALACRMRIISGYYVENQISIYKGFKALNAFSDAGAFESLQIKKAFDESSVIRHFNSNLIDGKSGERIREFLVHFAA